MPNPLYRTVTRCCACDGEDLAQVLSLGEHMLTNFVADDTPVLKAPLVLVRCAICSLVQLQNQVDPAVLYGYGDGKDGAETGTGSYYWYRSSMSRVMRSHLASLMAAVRDEAGLGPRDIVVDIGCNDGEALGSLLLPGLLKVGFEPGQRLADEARHRGAAYVFNSFFDATTYEATFNRRAQAVTAVAMFYDVARPLDFLLGIERILDYRGVAVIEMNTLWDMVQGTAYDMIGHEHLCYWSLRALDPLLRQVGLRLFRVERVKINGGSLRLWLCHENDPRETEGSVRAQRVDEERGLTARALVSFWLRASVQAGLLHDWVAQEVARGGRVYVWGASTRGRTIMQAARLDGLIAGASEIHPDKIGKTIAGTRIPIVHEEKARADATAFVVLPYSYRADVLEKESAFVKGGGKLVFPLPEMEVV